MKFKLEKTTKAKTCNEDVYHYIGEDGRKVAFHSHPTQAFHIVVVEGDEKLATDVYDAYVTNGLAQHSYAGGLTRQFPNWKLMNPLPRGCSF